MRATSTQRFAESRRQASRDLEGSCGGLVEA
jgi:hypothetical protein